MVLKYNQTTITKGANNMIIGIPRETKEHEYRVASIPSEMQVSL